MEIKSPNRLLRLPSVLEKVSFSKSELYRRLAAGSFPPPIILGERCRAWRESDIDAWIESLTQVAAK
jgi:prophage regulatory protein